MSWRTEITHSTFQIPPENLEELRALVHVPETFEYVGLDTVLSADGLAIVGHNPGEHYSGAEGLLEYIGHLASGSITWASEFGEVWIQDYTYLTHAEAQRLAGVSNG